MAPKGWTADDQSKFLWGQEGDFRKAQVTRRFDDLWNSIMAEWVRRWPVIDSVFPGQNLKVEDLDESQLEKYNKALEKLRIVSCAFMVRFFRKTQYSQATNRGLNSGFSGASTNVAVRLPEVPPPRIFARSLRTRVVAS